MHLFLALILKIMPRHCTVHVSSTKCNERFVGNGADTVFGEWVGGFGMDGWMDGWIDR